MFSTFAGKDGNAEPDCFSRADFTLLVKNDGIIIDRVVNSDRFDIGTTPVGKGILNKIFTDRNTLDKTAEALNGKGVASFIFMNDVDKYVLTINAFGADRGGISLIGAFRISNVYIEGYNIKESIWSSLIGTGLLMIVLVASMIVSRKIKKREIFRLEMIDPVLNCSTPKKFGKDAHDILKRNSGTSFAFVSFQINNFTYILKKFGDTETQKFSKFVAATIRQALLLEETFAYGGEGEFLILLHFKERQNFTERLNAIYLRISSYSVNDANGKYNIGVYCSVYEAEQSERASVRNMLEKLKIVKETPYSKGLRAKVRCYGVDDVREGVAVMHKEGVDVSITGNSTNPTRFQHPVAGTYKKECYEQNKKYFSVASGGGTGRTLHPDNMAAGPASYGMTDTMGRMHSDAQFAGSSSVPAHVEMMGFLGMGNNPMVGATVAVAVAIEEAMK